MNYLYSTIGLHSGVQKTQPRPGPCSKKAYMTLEPGGGKRTEILDSHGQLELAACIYVFSISLPLYHLPLRDGLHKISPPGTEQPQTS